MSASRSVGVAELVEVAVDPTGQADACENTVRAGDRYN